MKCWYIRLRQQLKFECCPSPCQCYSRLFSKLCRQVIVVGLVVKVALKDLPPHEFNVRALHKETGQISKQRQQQQSQFVEAYTQCAGDNSLDHVCCRLSSASMPYNVPLQPTLLEAYLDGVVTAVVQASRSCCCILHPLVAHTAGKCTHHCQQQQQQLQQRTPCDCLCDRLLPSCCCCLLPGSSQQLLAITCCCRGSSASAALQHCGP